MKKRLLATLTLSVLLMVGCSNKEHILYSTNGVIYNDKKEVKVQEHCGNTASSKLNGGEFDILYSFHSGFEDCPNNQAKVTEDNVTVLDKKNKITYFTAYLGSQYTMHKKTNDGYVCGFLLGEAEMESNQVLTRMSDEILNLELGVEYTKAVLDDCIFVSNFNSVKVRPDTIVIPGLVMVTKGNVQTDSTKQVGEITVGFTSSEKFDYYQWNEYVVKAEKGYDISQCVTFKPKK